MKTVTVAAVALLLASAWQLPADTAIGTISLQQGLIQNGYQTVAVNNFTGSPNGCASLDPSLPVCNGVTIENWRMEIDFTAEVAGLAPSPLIFTSQGVQDNITPTQVIDSYTGDQSDSWTLPFDVTNANCSPTCDAQISQIIFSGTLDTTTLLLYNGDPNGPYITETLNSPDFITTWLIPASDYTPSSGTLYDTTDIDVTQTPEPASFLLFMAAGVTLGLIKRAGLFSIGR
jgi:hypothetical protein